MQRSVVNEEENSVSQAIFLALVREDMLLSDRDHYLDRIRKSSNGLKVIREAREFAMTRGTKLSSNYDLINRVQRDLENAIDRSMLEAELEVNLSIHSPQVKRR